MTTRQRAHGDGRDDADDAVDRYLAERGVADHVRARGLRGMIDDWARIAASAERYDLTLDDWINDLDLRDIIAGALTVASPSAQQKARAVLARADERFRAATVECARPLLGAADESVRSPDPQAAWWYRRVPARPGATMRDDLASAGVHAPADRPKRR
jgi:hypothetical protein